MSQTAKIVLSIVLTALIVGGGIYYLMDRAAQVDKNELEAQIEELQTEVRQLITQEIESEQYIVPGAMEMISIAEIKEIAKNSECGDNLDGTYEYPTGGNTHLFKLGLTEEKKSQDCLVDLERRKAFIDRIVGQD